MTRILEDCIANRKFVETWRGKRYIGRRSQVDQGLLLGFGTRSPALGGGGTHFLSVAPAVEDRRIGAVHELLAAAGAGVEEPLAAGGAEAEVLPVTADVEVKVEVVLIVPAPLVPAASVEELERLLAVHVGVQVDTGGTKEDAGSYWNDDVAGRKCGEGLSWAVSTSTLLEVTATSCVLEMTKGMMRCGVHW